MKTTILAGIMLASAVTAHAGEYQFRHYLSGLKPAPVSAPEEPVEQDESWTLSSATLPRATSDEAYSYSFYDLVTPSGLTGFQWAGSGLPAWASLDFSTGELSGTPSSADIGNKSFSVAAVRGDAADEKVFTITVGGQTLNIKQISSGAGFSCAVTATGGAKCWGTNSYGQLGNNSTTAALKPVDVTGLQSGVVSIHASQFQHACALLNTGAVMCWGGNSYRQLGSFTGAKSLVPVGINGLSGTITQLTTGEAHSCALFDDGAAKCWGKNQNAILGNGTSGRYEASPVLVTATSDPIRSISAGSNHTCVVTTAGAAQCWGYGGQGILGNGGISQSSVAVTPTGLGSGVKSISAGASHTCAVTDTGEAKCWGANSFGQLGNASTTTSYSPVSVRNLTNVANISTGMFFSCATTTTGAAYCWGTNSSGTLGSGSTAQQSVTPSPVFGLSEGVASISAGNSLTCAMMSDGAAKCWGHGGYGGDGTNTIRRTPVDVLLN